MPGAAPESHSYSREEVAHWRRRRHVLLRMELDSDEALLPFHRCRSEAEADRVPADAWSSSKPVAPDSAAVAPARV
jgi:hypothetical protein